MTTTPTRKHKRIPNDFYPTESKLTEALLRHQPIFGTVFECCAGNGAITSTLEERGFTVYSGDVDLARCGITPYWIEHFDATDPHQWQNCNSTDWVITNPPFNQSAKIIPLAYQHATSGIAMLLRLTWLEPCGDRADFLKLHPPTKVIVFNPRPKFRADTRGTDSTTVAWFAWHKFGTDRQTRILFETGWDK